MKGTSASLRSEAIIRFQNVLSLILPTNSVILAICPESRPSVIPTRPAVSGMSMSGSVASISRSL